MTLPREYRGGLLDGVVEGAWHPHTKANHLRVTIPGDYLTFLATRSLAGSRDARHVSETLKTPDSVFETDSGNFMYYRSIAARPGEVFCVRVRPTGWRAFRWQFEDADDDDPSIPSERGKDRFRRRIR